MVTYVAIVAENQTALVVSLAATLADRAVKAAPTLLENDLRYFDAGAVGMVTLAALGASDQTTLLVGADRTAHYADVLRQDEFVLRRTEY